MEKQKVLVIVGPTASGKSELAVRLAESLGGEIISADSRQVYRGLNIGTGKITKKEMRGIPHHLLDVAGPKNHFSASTYRELGEEALNKILARGKLPIIAGGTGFYIDTLAGKVSLPEVPPNTALRAKLSKKSSNELFQILKKKDPVRAKTIDRHNKVRIVRALEIVESLGKVPTRRRGMSTGYEFIYIGLKPDGDKLDERIRARLDKRMNAMLAEGKRLHTKGLTYRRMNELGLEYRYIALYLQGKLTKAEMREKLYIEIRKYSKRQMTWFKRNKKIKWFKPGEYKQIEKYAKTKF